MSGVVGLILVAGAIFFLVRRSKRNGARIHLSLIVNQTLMWSTIITARHSFNPSKFYATELSPRTASATPADADVKLQPYARMSDEPDTDTDRKARLEVPAPAYAISLNGLRARSPSPDPDRKAAANAPR